MDDEGVFHFMKYEHPDPEGIVYIFYKKGKIWFIIDVYLGDIS